MTTMIKERPIIFNAEMVRAILDGRKTMTRRVVRDVKGNSWLCREAKSVFDLGDEYHRKEVAPCHCPYGVPGDRLYVRETWRVVGWPEGDPIVIETKDGTRYDEDTDYIDVPQWEDWYYRMAMQSSDDCDKAGIPSDNDGRYLFTKEKVTVGNQWPKSGVTIEDRIVVPTRWRRSIHMPRWASRILLEVVSVRVERVQDMPWGDVAREGLEACEEFVGCFQELWDSINLKRGYGWDVNPWVWVIEFKRITAGDN